MFNEVIKTIEFGNQQLTLKTGKIAKQAEGSVIAMMGDTIVLCTVTAEKQVKENVDFFPLSVHYREMSSASGKIPGGFVKREGKSSDREVLISRLIDRPNRPMFPDGFYNETQILCTLLSYDPACSPDIVAMIGTAAALSISGLPYKEPVVAVKVGFINDNFVLNPNHDELKDSKLELTIAGTANSIMMIESGAYQLSEQQMLEAIHFGQSQFQPVINIIKELEQEVGRAKWSVEFKNVDNLISGLQHDYSKEITAAFKIADKRERRALTKMIADTAIEKYKVAPHNFTELEIQHNLDNLKSNIIRDNIIHNTLRIDGRKPADIRDINCEVSLLPRAHGSSLFTRGETQTLVSTTLGTTQDEQIIDSLESNPREHFMLNYIFPPYSVGEVGNIRAPGRREIGHGRLASRALIPVLPERGDFPYSFRVVSEVTSCNGSSSMATVCGASLSLMDAGVPLTQPVAGIAMGLIKQQDNFVILSDILGDEDALGDMDLKVTGTSNGITALQMDSKIDNINIDIIKQALEQARVGRLHILERMNNTLSNCRSTVSRYAPIIKVIQISKDKIRDLIGPNGKIIKDICERTGAKIDVKDSGLVEVATVGLDSLNKAIELIMDVAGDPEINKIYSGVVVKIIDSGAFINFFGSKDGFLHISEISETRVTDVKDHLKVGETIQVKLIDFDKGKSKLSVKQLKSETNKSQENVDQSVTPQSITSKTAVDDNTNSIKRPAEPQHKKNWTTKKPKLEEQQTNATTEHTSERKYFN